MRPVTSLALLGFAALLLAPPAQAAMVAGTLDFTVTGFQANDPAAPQDTLTGSVSLLFDDAVSVTNQTAGISVIALNFVPTSAVAFSYDAAQDILTIGGLASGVAVLATSGSDFLVSVQNLFTAPPTQILGAYSIAPEAYSSVGHGSATFTVPEPASLAVLGMGLLGLAGTRLRRRG